MKYITILLLLCGTANAATIAIIDSGTDLTHNQLKNKSWVNAVDVDDAVDNDDNGYIDDVNGWNFAENNNKLIDKKYLGTFSPDVYKFFEVQGRLIKGEATDADRKWMEDARNNQSLIAELQTFGNFVHGTHVAGIAAKNADKAQIMGLKIIPTKSPGTSVSAKIALFTKAIRKEAPAVTGDNSGIIKMGLKALAGQQAKSLAPIGEYANKQKARIANCSFGTSVEAVKTILPQLLKLVLRREPTEEELDMYATYFVSEIVQASQVFVTSAPNTLFVMAAGNDGTDNDVLPTSPANIKLDNTITVAATMDYKNIAKFSNYGTKMVEVAAPGVTIESSIPGNLTLSVSGTSQAAPFVANAAGLLVDTNSNLSNLDIKKILMATSDMKDFLQGKVTSGGIVNTARAMAAANLSKSMQLADAIAAARAQISDVKVTGMDADFENESANVFVLPLPSTF